MMELSLNKVERVRGGYRVRIAFRYYFVNLNMQVVALDSRPISDAVYYECVSLAMDCRKSAGRSAPKQDNNSEQLTMF